MQKQAPQTTPNPRCGGTLHKIIHRLAMPDAEKRLASLAHYASDERPDRPVQRTQREESIKTVCGARQGSSVSTNTNSLTL